MKRKYNHTEQFWNEKWDEISQFCKDKSIINPYPSKEALQMTWDSMRKEGYKDITKQMKYELQYNTGYKTALNEYQMLKELGYDVKLRDIKKMTTHEIVDLYPDFKKTIKDAYKFMKENGMDATEAAENISRYYFNS